jgi:hypothetical protein
VDGAGAAFPRAAYTDYPAEMRARLERAALAELRVGFWLRGARDRGGAGKGIARIGEEAAAIVRACLPRARWTWHQLFL